MATVNAQLHSGTRTTITARQFSWLADEPHLAGGPAAGPTPYEILLGALAACITTTLRLSSDHQGIRFKGSTFLWSSIAFTRTIVSSEKTLMGA